MGKQIVDGTIPKCKNHNMADENKSTVYASTFGLFHLYNINISTTPLLHYYTIKLLKQSRRISLRCQKKDKYFINKQGK